MPPVCLGGMQTGRDAGAIVVGVILVTSIGEPLLHLKYTQRRRVTIKDAPPPK
jgi:hypothetical protein